jgi:hypothetical protein
VLYTEYIEELLPLPKPDVRSTHDSQCVERVRDEAGQNPLARLGTVGQRGTNTCVFDWTGDESLLTKTTSSVCREGITADLSSLRRSVTESCATPGRPMRRLCMLGSCWKEMSAQVHE